MSRSFTEEVVQHLCHYQKMGGATHTLYCSVMQCIYSSHWSAREYVTGQLWLRSYLRSSIFSRNGKNVFHFLRELKSIFFFFQLQPNSFEKTKAHTKELFQHLRICTKTDRHRRSCSKRMQKIKVNCSSSDALGFTFAVKINLCTYNQVEFLFLWPVGHT